MTTLTEQSLASEPASQRRGPKHESVDALAHAIILAGAAGLAIGTAHTAHWNLVWLGIIVALAVLSEMTAVKLPTGSFTVTGSFLAMTLAAVVLGGAPAAIVGVVTISVGWFQSRERPYVFRNNLTTYAWFPLLTGLLFHWLMDRTGLTPTSADYYLLVFASFMVALILNFAMIAGYECLLNRLSVWHKLGDLRPIMAAELFSAVLTLIAVYLTNRLHEAGLALFALVLVVFQYLVGELLISERRGEELRVLATTDELTGLINRKHFSDRVDEEIERSSQSGDGFGVLILDLHRFKEINDTLGHQYGDDLLAELAPRLVERAGARGVVARFGGDAFAIVPDQRTADIGALGRIAVDLLECVQEPVMISDVTVQADCSIGAARYPNDGTDAQTLVRRADIALNQAKENRDAYRIYDPVHDHHSTRQLGMLADFRRALENGEIVLHYHPIIDLSPHRICGAEALVRWEHPQLGLLQPAAFLQAVEQTGLIGQMTLQVLDQAIAECARWRAHGRELSVGVNLSVRNLLDPMLASEVDRKLRQYELPPEALKLEITESMIVSDPERALSTVRELGSLGAKLAVDDFGTGHSSLANLRRLPVDELKIDRSFVTPMLGDASDMVIVRSTIDLGHALGLKVIAEGVETAETLDRLGELGCDRAQGHFLSTPMPAEQFLHWAHNYERSFKTAA